MAEKRAVHDAFKNRAKTLQIFQPRIDTSSFETLVAKPTAFTAKASGRVRHCVLRCLGRDRKLHIGTLDPSSSLSSHAAGERAGEVAATQITRSAHDNPSAAGGLHRANQGV